MRYRWEIMSQIAEQRVIGIVRTATPAQAVEPVRDMLAAGLRTVEVALTTPDALTAIREIVAAAPADALIGAGTVLDAAAAGAAIEAGARFLVSPSLHADVIRTGHRHGVAVIPGVATPTEIVRGLELGADALKLFPASGWSPSWLKDVRAALPQAPIVPTGGISVDSAPHWIAAGAVACGMGSALTSGGPLEASGRVARLLAAIQAC
ncbi:bifunctional 4-hydroxy-2-oxoglutarate aldolase/2-dehydro-3-deoxy-phosphogluconate aldolase [Nonomuraea sp. LPB2021202275-12-8]|uniref:bifunctional 4-hydroxy-2-oxoglutarate aldolase/2-dehydro-3-deoxy-phosphogluconate aldolase n=1 Tax=Nonomuraea sp. LPB2021202275-12-8 TaxID=3120159 RepID=UPI00300C907F